MKSTIHVWKDAAWDHPLPQTSPTLVLCFGGQSLGDEASLFESLAQAAGSAPILGCSTAGEIHQDQVLDDSLLAVFITFDQVEVVFASQLVDGNRSFETGEALALDLRREAGDRPLKHVFVLCDGLAVNGTTLAAGLRTHLEDEVVVTGGLAADGDRFANTWVATREGPGKDRVAAVGLCGEALEVGHGSRGGWDPFGIQRRVTKSKGNVLYELDGQPALELYKEYLGERAAGLPSTGLLFPLTLTERENVVRTILAVDEEEQSLTFAGDIPQGETVQLMRANFERLIGGAADAVQATGADRPVLAIAISCVGRRLVLRSRIEDELEAALTGLPHGSTLVGFYSYGELSPTNEGPCALHNQTMTVTTWRER